jgi:hypothetical protein
MACIIVIQSIVAFHASGATQPNRITVSGAVHDCTGIDVAILVSGQTVGPRSATIDTQTGGWTADFSVANGDFALGDFTCGPQGDTTIRATCQQDKNCKDAFKVDDLPCQTGNACPLFTKVSGIPVSDAAGGCNGGLRQVNFAGRTAASGVVVEFDVTQLPNGPVFTAPSVAADPNVDFASQLDLPAGDYAFVLRVVSPHPCPGPTGFFTVDACPGGPTDPVCPVVTLDAPTGLDTACDAQGNRQIGLRAHLTPVTGQPVDASLSVSRSNPPGFAPVTVQARTNQAAAFQLQGQVSLPPGDYTASVDVTTPGVCNESNIDFTVPACPVVLTPPPPPHVQPPVQPPETPSCTFWRIFGLVLLFVGLGAVLGGACANIVPLEIVGAIVAAIGAAIIVAWAFLCPSVDRCFILRNIINMLGILVIALAILGLIGPIIAGIFFPNPEIGCFVGALIDTGIVGTTLVILLWVAQSLRCPGFR